MSETTLLDCAESAFAAIEKSTGVKYWDGPSGLLGAIEAFGFAVKTLGVAGLIDATSGTGMTHIGWCQWMHDARVLCGV